MGKEVRVVVVVEMMCVRMPVFGEDLVAVAASHADGKGRGMQDGTCVAARHASRSILVDLQGFGVAFEEACFRCLEDSGGFGVQYRLD